MKVFAAIATGVALLASTPAVQGHGYIVDPAAQWTQGYPSNGYGSTIESNVWGTIDTSTYGYGANATVQFFNTMLEQEGDSLAGFIAKNQQLYSNEIDPDCGLTAFDDSARSALPASQLTYTGFTHPGPCEVWCGDTNLLFVADCQAEYPDIPAIVPYEASKCADANRLTFYWVALHGEPWQVYTNCVWLEGGSGKGSAPAGGGSSTTTTTTTTTTTGSTADDDSNPESENPSTPYTPSSPDTPSTPNTPPTPSTPTTPNTPPTPSTPTTPRTPSAPKCNRRQQT